MTNLESQTSGSTPAKKRSAGQWIQLCVLLGLPYVFLCFPSLYNRATPTLLGFPFFYWYQLAWVLVTSALLWIVSLMLRTK